MIRSPNRLLAAAAVTTAIVGLSARAAAQAAPEPTSIVVGAWTFRPLAEVRVRGEYRRHPFDTGGASFDAAAVLAEAYGSSLPAITSVRPEVKDQLAFTERVRLGLGVDRGPVTAVVTLQDARVWGDSSAALAGAGQPLLPAFAPSEGYIDVHTRTGRKVFFRVGRQQVTWGDGRLLGANDWSPTGRSLDAGRFGFQVGDFDFELLAAMLAPPGGLPPAATGGVEPASEGPGSQLYGANVAWHALPLLNVEATWIGRVARAPLPITLTPSDTYVLDGRLYGERRGFRYTLEGAYELGQVASYGVNRKLGAFAGAASLSWETALPGHLTFGAEGADASGDKGETKGKVTRFDPILPDEHTHLGAMGLFAWSNILTVGGTIGARPIDELGLLAGYRYAALAEPGGRWTSASLVPIGADPRNPARSLGHEIDAAIRITPWKPFEIETGYGIFLRGTGADAILQAAARPATLQHWAYLQTTVRVP